MLCNILSKAIEEKNRSFDQSLALRNLADIVRAAIFLNKVNLKEGYVPDYCLFGLDIPVEIAREIRDIVQSS